MRLVIALLLLFVAWKLSKLRDVPKHRIAQSNTASHADQHRPRSHDRRMVRPVRHAMAARSQQESVMLFVLHFCLCLTKKLEDKK